MTQVLEQRVPDDPFYEGFCPVSHWKKTKKRYYAHCFEIIEPTQIGTMMHFRYISRIAFENLILETFNSDEE